MIKLKDLGTARIIVENEDYRQFLRQLKQEGFLWRSGKIIKPDFDRYLKSFRSMAVIDNEGFVFHPKSFMGFYSTQSLDEYHYKDIKEAEKFDANFIVSKRTSRIDEDYEAIRKAQEVIYKNKCKRNRKINEIQLKNIDKAKSLQKNFFVKYENEFELIKLIDLLENHGYENVYDINIDNLVNGTKVLIIDNKEMTFSPCSITICACAKSALKKFYTVDSFDKILIEIFDK